MTLPGNVPRENRRGLIQGDGSLGPARLQVHPGFIQDTMNLPWLQIGPHQPWELGIWGWVHTIPAPGHLPPWRLWGGHFTGPKAS